MSADERDRWWRDARLGIVSARRTVTLLGGRFVFARDWYRHNRWAGLDFAPSATLELSIVPLPATLGRYEDG